MTEIEGLDRLKAELQAFRVPRDVYAFAVRAFTTAISPMGYPPIEAYGNAIASALDMMRQQEANVAHPPATRG